MGEEFKIVVRERSENGMDGIYRAGGRTIGWIAEEDHHSATFNHSSHLFIDRFQYHVEEFKKIANRTLFGNPTEFSSTYILQV